MLTVSHFALPQDLCILVQGVAHKLVLMVCPCTLVGHPRPVQVQYSLVVAVTVLAVVDH